MSMCNQSYVNRMIKTAAALTKLNDLDITVINIDINRALPVINVQRCRALTALESAVVIRRGTSSGRINIHQAPLNGCRIEWEVAA